MNQKKNKSEISRRDFIKRTAASAVGIAAIGILNTGTISAATTDIATEAGSSKETDAISGIDPKKVENVGYAWINTENTSPIEPVDPPASWDYEVDCIVVGSGAGGIAATAHLAKEGLSVICVEAFGELMGTSKYASWIATNGGIPSIYGTWGNQSNPYDRNVVFDRWMENCKYSADAALMWNLVDSGPECYEWWVQQGLELVDILEAGGLPAGTFSGSLCVPGGTQYDARIGIPGYANNAQPVLEAMIRMAEGWGAEFKTLTPVEALVVENDRVIGVKAKDDIYFKASKGVLLHAGDFAYNRDMLLRFVPKVGMGAPNSVEVPTNNGLCTRMCLGLGATMTGFNSFSVRDGTIDVGDLTKDRLAEGNREVRWRSMYFADEVLCRQPWLRINKAGGRTVFAFSGDGSEAEHAEQIMSNSEMGTAGHREFVIFDDNGLKNYATTFGQKGGRIPLTNDMPFMDDQSRVPPAAVDKDFYEGVNKSLEAGYIKSANTLGELAALLGLDADKVTNAVERWNTNCEIGEDDPGYGYKPEWLIPIAVPPYYGACLGGSIQAIQTGIKVNADMQVLKDDKDPIPGLYAGFHTAGGAVGDGVQGGAIYSCVSKSLVSGWMSSKGLLDHEV